MHYRHLGPESIAYYEANAQGFFDGTVALDLSVLHTRFLAWLPAGGHILDAGCGSGRDARAFLEQGYTMTACDASPALAALASTHCGLPVQVLRLEEIDWQARFDGIWACASLLHLSLLELPPVLLRLAVALKPNGILFTSFKHGQGEREHGGRRFTDLDEAGLAALVRAAPYFTVLETWITLDRRPEQTDDRWLNALLKVQALFWRTSWPSCRPTRLAPCRALSCAVALAPTSAAKSPP